MNTSLLLIIAGCVIVILLVAVIVLWSCNVKLVHKVEFLFQAIDNGDYTFRFPESGKSRFINTTLNRLKEILQHARDEQIEKEKYFEFILNSVDTGVLVVDAARGLVLRCNAAALKLLNRDVITHINQVKDKFKNFFVILFTISTDKVSFTDTSFSQDSPNTSRMVVGVNPITNVFTITVKFWSNT